jgi:hypothetical protein
MTALAASRTGRLAAFRLFGTALALSLLSGCANPDVQAFFDPLKHGLSALDDTLRSANAGAVPPAEDVEAPPQAAAHPPPQSAAAKPAPAAVPVAESTIQAAPAQTAALPRAAVPALRAASELVGLDSTTIEQRLGTPVLRRRDAPAELWQYRSPLCVMDVFLYSDGRSFKVMHVELHSRSVEQVQAPTCLASFDEPPKPSPTSG